MPWCKTKTSLLDTQAVNLCLASLAFAAAAVAALHFALMQTLQQFEEEANAVPAGGNDAFNPFEQPAYAAGGGRGKGKGVTGVCACDGMCARTWAAVCCAQGDTFARIKHKGGAKSVTGGCLPVAVRACGAGMSMN